MISVQNQVTDSTWDIKTPEERNRRTIKPTPNTNDGCIGTKARLTCLKKYKTRV